MEKIIDQDLRLIYGGLTDKERSQFGGATILLTGCAGFLGFYFLHFFHRYREELGIDEIIGLDNFQVGYPAWLKKLEESGGITFHKYDIITDDIAEVPGVEKATYIYHMASIASPTFYRKYPIETLDANIWGLRRLLDFYKEKPIRGFAFYSSSEIYGDPVPDQIPTSEDYRGNVSCVGPRACYDEAKRFGETMCYLFHERYQMPLRIIRPFNNYGPGMRLNDSRVPADFAKAVLEGRDIVMFSDGTPTRTFCYITDAITGYLKVLLHNNFDAFNIGMDYPEISIRQLAEIYQTAGKEVFNYSGEVKFEVPADKEYLTHNPNRRCPDLTKARTLLGYSPSIHVEEGVRRFLQFIKESDKGELVW
ncbi:NAD-dependent epimerase/dehydratase family protein [Gorillibacterium sp. CAU 1737]|uniref:NAD-dependent epimerase/dehydratase family protein n=1 Tax=Gorillibacterium sp. CAU 1737 TaxID=3140362 RepID=UPI003261166A